MIKSKVKINLKKVEEEKGIWKYSNYLFPIASDFRLSLDEGNTKEVFFDEEILLKREDMNPTGSLKDRGMAYLVSKAFSEGQKELVLSSSGNAAVSAAEYCRLAGIKLTTFVSTKINKLKLEEIKSRKAEVFFSRRPVSDSIKFSKKNNLVNLRPSVSVFGQEGFQTIAFELLVNQGVIENLFVPVGSGVALIGVAEGFRKFGLLPKIHCCQPSAVCPISSLFDKNYLLEKENMADSLVTKYSPLKDKVAEIVRESGGFGWVIGNSEIIEAQRLLEKNKIKTSNEGALALAAIFKARKSGWRLGKTVCLLTGKKY